MTRTGWNFYSNEIGEHPIIWGCPVNKRNFRVRSQSIGPNKVESLFAHVCSMLSSKSSSTHIVYQSILAFDGVQLLIQAAANCFNSCSMAGSNFQFGRTPVWLQHCLETVWARFEANCLFHWCTFALNWELPCLSIHSKFGPNWTF